MGTQVKSYASVVCVRACMHVRCVRVHVAVFESQVVSSCIHSHTHVKMNKTFGFDLSNSSAEHLKFLTV